MPEGDSVYQLSKRLQWMAGKVVTKTSIQVPRYATVDFTGMTCKRVWPYGKHLFMEFAAPGHESQILHTHLKMEGTWSMHRAGTRWKKPAHAARVVLLLDDAPRDPIELVGFWLGLVRVFPAREYEAEMGYLGPDLLDPDFDADEAVRRIKAHPDLEIGRALLDRPSADPTATAQARALARLAAHHGLPGDRPAPPLILAVRAPTGGARTWPGRSAPS